MSQNIGGIIPAVADGGGYDVIDDVVSTRHTLQSMSMAGRTFSVETIDDVVAVESETNNLLSVVDAFLADNLTPLGSPLTGKLITVEVIKTDIYRELFQGRVPESLYALWTPPDVDHPAVGQISRVLQLQNLGSGDEHIVTFAMTQEVNGLIHGFVEEAFSACGRHDYSQHHGNATMTCNIVDQVVNVLAIVKGYGLKPALETLESTV